MYEEQEKGFMIIFMHGYFEKFAFVVDCGYYFSDVGRA